MRSKPANRADAFSRDLCRALGNSLGLKWAQEARTADEHECVDVIGQKGKKTRVLIEVELRRKNPVANIVKVWRL